MDKYKEAIGHLKRTVSQLKYLDERPDTPYTKHYIKKRNEKNRRRLRANRLAIEALEKQIPKPPVEKVNPKYPALGKMYYCECGVLFTGWGRPEEETNFCGNCGQKLKGESE